jgi:osmotically inducible protein OsmC
MVRNGSAVWRGGLRDGGGTVSTESGALKDVSYSFGKRFGDEKGTNPEELIAAAHAGCYTMQLSGVLGAAGLTAEEIRTSAAISGEMEDGGFTIKASHLTVEARIPGADAAKFAEAAETAKRICPVSKVLNAEITVDAKLVG